MDKMRASYSSENHPALKTNRNKSELEGEYVDCLDMWAVVLKGSTTLDERNFRFFWLLYGSNNKDDSSFELMLRRVFQMENKDLG